MVVLRRQHLVRDGQQILGFVIGEIEVMRDPRAQARIGPEKSVHPVLVAGQYHHQVVALVFHHLQQDLDRFLAVVALVLGPVEVVGLVDEEHPAHGPLQDLLGLRRGVSDVLADQVVARDGDQVALPDVAQPVQDLRHAHGDGGLAGARIAGEAHVQRRRLRLKTEIHAQFVDHEERRDVANTALDRRQTDQIPVEFIEHVAGVAARQHVGDRAGLRLTGIRCGTRVRGDSRARTRAGGAGRDALPRNVVGGGRHLKRPWARASPASAPPAWHRRPCGSRAGRIWRCPRRRCRRRPRLRGECCPA